MSKLFLAKADHLPDSGLTKLLRLFALRLNRRICFFDFF